MKVRNELTCDVKNLSDIKNNHVITHLHCDDARPEKYKDRMRTALGIPDNRDHPLLI